MDPDMTRVEDERAEVADPLEHDQPREEAIAEVRCLLQSSANFSHMPVHLAQIMQQIDSRLMDEKRILGDDLFSLNDAIFNVPVGAAIDRTVACRLFQLISQ